MSKNSTAAKTEENVTPEVKPTMAVVPAEKATEKPTPETPRELTLEEKIRKVENLQLIVNKRTRILDVMGDLDRFRVGSNDFNCKLSLQDSDGNKFETTFTPGVKKVIDFLKQQFDESLNQIEEQIKF